MTIQIGERSLSTRRPKDLNRALLAETGCDAVEFARMLGGAPLAGTIASGLLPWLAEDDRPALPVLAAEIEAAGKGEIAARVLALYTSAGADDLDGVTVAKAREIAAEEGADLSGLKRLDDIVGAIRARRLAKAEEAARLGE